MVEYKKNGTPISTTIALSIRHQGLSIDVKSSYGFHCETILYEFAKLEM